MAEKKREVQIAPAAVDNMHAARPSDDELNAIEVALKDLALDPELGYKVAFAQPPLYRLDAGRFHIHYNFSPTVLSVFYIGVY